MDRRLAAAMALLSLTTAKSPLLVRWAYREWNGGRVVLAAAPAVPFVAVAAFTLWQQRRSPTMTWFAGRPLSTALFVMSVWVEGACTLGYWILLLGIVMVPVAAALLALA